MSTADTLIMNHTEPWDTEEIEGSERKETSAFHTPTPNQTSPKIFQRNTFKGLKRVQTTGRVFHRNRFEETTFNVKPITTVLKIFIRFLVIDRLWIPQKMKISDTLRASTATTSITQSQVCSSQNNRLVTIYQTTEATLYPFAFHPHNPPCRAGFIKCRGGSFCQSV